MPDWIDDAVEQLSSTMLHVLAGRGPGQPGESSVVFLLGVTEQVNQETRAAGQVKG